MTDERKTRTLLGVAYGCLIGASFVLFGCESGGDSGTSDASAFGGPAYFVAPAGDDARTCDEAMEAATPKRTLASSIRCLGSGETLVVEDGTYEESIDDVIPSGSSWDRATVIRARNYRGAVIKPSLGGLYGFNFVNADSHFIVIKDLVLDMINSSVQCVRLINGGNDNDGFPHHIRLDGIECRNTLGSAITWNNGSNLPTELQGRENELINCRLHHNGRRRDILDTAVYWNSRDSLVRNCEIDHNGTSGITLFRSGGGTPTGAVVENNLIHENAFYAVQVASTHQVMIRNNIVYGHAYTFAVELGSGSVGSVQDIQFFHNTIVNNAGHCLFGDHPQSARIVVRNNICSGNRTDTISITGATVSNNLEGGSDIFSDPAAGNYRLVAAGTSAIDRGADLAGAVPLDADGVSRFQGAAPDLGAYEFIPRQ